MKNGDMQSIMFLRNTQISWILYANAVTTLSLSYKYTIRIVTVNILHFTGIPKCKISVLRKTVMNL